MIKHYGFSYAPVGLISALEKTNASANFYILDPFSGKHLPYDELTEADKTNLFVVIYTHEGASHYWFDRLIPKLINDCGIPAKHIILHSSCLYDPESPIGHIGSIVDYASDMISRYPNITQVETYSTCYHFVCLNRVHRWQRLELIKQLIDKNLCRYGLISYTQPVPQTDPYHQHFPMIVDYDKPSYEQGHELAPGLSNALYNVICESCYEPKTPEDTFESHPLPGLTEKTFKSIVLGQIPIFVAAHKTVQCYRNLGFDAFDDLVDHSYDLEIDPTKRLSLVVNQIEKATQIKDLQTLRSNLMPRFDKNFSLLKYYSNNWSVEVPLWQQYFKELTNN